MKLIRLILQGFKSFADRTTIDFAEGMTVIVGPNGCGKSNISDAVRWVLGEQNVRNIRGQKAEDIIFSGSEKRKAKNAAMVSLILDNSGHELPLDTAEVSITRKIFRNGDSEFYINKRSCRLKDIQELLANTGIGKGSMVIIGQNQVDRILSARPEERRVIFEEVAGISKYRMKKVDGLRKLEKASATGPEGGNGRAERAAPRGSGKGTEVPCPAEGKKDRCSDGRTVKTERSPPYDGTL